MKKTYLFALVLAVVMLAIAGTVLMATPVEAKGEPAVASFEKSVPGDNFLLPPNCSWTCSDGRTGSAEVLSAEACGNTCAAACGEACVAAE